MTKATTNSLYVNLSASQTRKRLKGHGFGVRKAKAERSTDSYAKRKEADVRRREKAQAE